MSNAATKEFDLQDFEPVVEDTDDIFGFKFLEWNKQRVDEQSVEELATVIRDSNIITPITVMKRGKELVVLDGQTRTLAAQLISEEDKASVKLQYVVLKVSDPYDDDVVFDIVRRLNGWRHNWSIKNVVKAREIRGDTIAAATNKLYLDLNRELRRETILCLLYEDLGYKVGQIFDLLMSGSIPISTKRVKNSMINEVKIFHAYLNAVLKKITSGSKSSHISNGLLRVYLRSRTDHHKPYDDDAHKLVLTMLSDIQGGLYEIYNSDMKRFEPIQLPPVTAGKQWFDFFCKIVDGTYKSDDHPWRKVAPRKANGKVA